MNLTKIASRRKTDNKLHANRLYALGRMKQGERNNTEKAYEEYLTLLKASNEIQWFAFQGMKFRISDGCFYTPDFNILRNDGTLECHEVKSIWIGDARVKIKAVAEMYPIKFVAVYVKKKRDGGGWELEDI